LLASYCTGTKVKCEDNSTVTNEVDDAGGAYTCIMTATNHDGHSNENVKN